MTVEFASLLRFSAAIRKPDLIDILKASNADAFDTLTVNGTGSRHRIKCFALLTHLLTQAVQPSDITAKDIFVKVVERIKVSIQPTLAAEARNEDAAGVND